VLLPVDDVLPVAALVEEWFALEAAAPPVPGAGKTTEPPQASTSSTTATRTPAIEAPSTYVLRFWTRSPSANRPLS
jgi:hypothetical protein